MKTIMLWPFEADSDFYFYHFRAYYLRHESTRPSIFSKVSKVAGAQNSSGSRVPSCLLFQGNSSYHYPCRLCAATVLKCYDLSAA